MRQDLSRRELEVLKLLSEGFTSNEIGDRLFISPHTVEFHRKNLLQKFNARNGIHLINEAYKQGCIIDGVSKSSAHHRPLKIVMVDNDKADQELFAAAVYSADPSHVVTFASDGEELLDIFHNMIVDSSSVPELPDVIFMELHMPRKGGLETLMELRRSESFSQVPVFIYTSSDCGLDIDMCYKKGANLFIIKPSNLDNLTRTLKSVCTLLNEFIVLPNTDSA